MGEFEYTDLSRLSDEEGERLCAQLRDKLLDSVSKTGGHLASNLGTVELTVALHRVFDTGRDRLVFDVGHQCYCHKILTGRGELMDTLRTFGGISGFPKPSESVHDAFIAGHASNSVSVAVGMARARTLLGEKYHVIALLGDGALTGGLAYEGLSDAGQSGQPLLVILNDNGMSITKSVGGVAKHLARQRLKPQYLNAKRIYRKITSVIPGGNTLYRVTHKLKKAVKGSLLPCSMFEDMGFTYIGPIDGHNLRELTSVLRWIKEQISGPVLLHIRTVKGKGYTYAEETPDAYHGVSPFQVEAGLSQEGKRDDFSAVFGRELARLAAEDTRICAVTAAMCQGTGLDEFAARFPERFFDVGIAEGHAVTMCSGMAKQGLLPVFAVYSTFLQRAYDMLIHDTAMQKLHVVFGVDRAGLVGSDGETHHGVFDLAFLSSVPHMTIFAPASFAELRQDLDYALYDLDGPVAIRYPRGGENGYSDVGDPSSACQVLQEGNDLTMVSYGTMIGEVLTAAERLRGDGISVCVIKLNRLNPLDTELIRRSVRKTERLLVAEEVMEEGCVGQRILSGLSMEGCPLKRAVLLNLGRDYITHGTVPQLRAHCGIDSAHIYEKAREAVL